MWTVWKIFASHEAVHNSCCLLLVVMVMWNAINHPKGIYASASFEQHIVASFGGFRGGYQII